MKSSLSIWRLLHTFKLTVKILSIFVAFLKNLDFMISFLFCNDLVGHLHCEPSMMLQGKTLLKGVFTAFVGFS